MSLQGLILDFGEVLTRPQPRHVIERMASLAKLPLADFEAQYWRHRAAYDGGLSGAEYWKRVLDGSGGESEELIDALIEADFQSWSDYRPEVWNIAAQFRGAGRRTAMLSNGVVEIASRLRAQRQLEQWFDAVIVSCDVGRCKPDPEIYRICLDKLGVPAESSMFVDDRIENLKAAETVGLHTFHFIGDASIPGLRTALGL